MAKEMMATRPSRKAPITGSDPINGVRLQYWVPIPLLVPDLVLVGRLDLFPEGEVAAGGVWEVFLVPGASAPDDAEAGGG
jgi:hypothetical protein